MDEPVSDNDVAGVGDDGPTPNTTGCGRCKESEITSPLVFCFFRTLVAVFAARFRGAFFEAAADVVFQPEYHQ